MSILLVRPLALLLAAAAVSPPRNVFSMEDYPPTAMERNEEGTVYVQLLVDPAGQVDNCSVVQSSGYPDLDFQTCAIAKRRARFIAAKDQDGRKVFGLFGFPITWSLSRPPIVTVHPDFDLTINHGPPGVRLPIEISVSFFITPAGAVTQCHGSETSSPLQLVDAACKLIESSSIAAVRDHNGAPVATMDCVTVRFAVQ